jgi:hypothetical protein
MFESDLKGESHANVGRDSSPVWTNRSTNLYDDPTVAQRRQMRKPTLVTLKQAEQRKTQRFILRICRPSGEMSCSPICRMTFCMAKSAVMMDTRAGSTPASPSTSSPDESQALLSPLALLPSFSEDSSSTETPPLHAVIPSPSRGSDGSDACWPGSLSGSCPVGCAGLVRLAI